MTDSAKTIPTAALAEIPVSRPPTPLYTLVAYRPDGVDSCRGHVMASSSSECSLQFFRDEAELVEAWARELSESAGRGREFASVECTLLIDGRDSYQWWEEPENEHATEAPHDALQRRAEARCLVLRDAVARKEAAHKAEAGRKAQEAATARERATYELLHARFGDR
jgi:hypothetical protein